VIGFERSTGATRIDASGKAFRRRADPQWRSDPIDSAI
jgi:hypothetical protein